MDRYNIMGCVGGQEGGRQDHSYVTGMVVALVPCQPGEQESRDVPAHDNTVHSLPADYSHSVFFHAFADQ